MLSQGWIPGSILGATGANSNPDAHFSYTRIKRREGNSGLGRSNQSSYDEGHSLDAFQEILGRLNGKPEVKCAAATIKSRDLKTVNYLESRWRVLKFVSGGLLTEDKSKDAVKPSQIMPSSHVTQVVTTSDALFDEEVDTGINGLYKQESMNSESPDAREVQESQDTAMPVSAHLAASERCNKRRESEAGEPKKRKKRKRAIDNPPEFEQLQQSLPEEALAKPSNTAMDGQTTPVIRSSLSSRHAVRIRYIRHKKMAMMDRNALNEVCFIFCITDRTQDY